MLYGVSPLAGRTGRDDGLRPAMTLTTRLIAVKELPCAASRRLWRRLGAAGDTRIGIAAMGYGDGYPRHAPLRHAGPGRRPNSALVGRVSMDMLAIDLRPSLDGLRSASL